MNKRKSKDEPPVVWPGISHETEEEPESDIPCGEREATRQEEHDATEHYPGPEHGRRGDLGDSGPGED